MRSRLSSVTGCVCVVGGWGGGGEREGKMVTEVYTDTYCRLMLQGWSSHEGRVVRSRLRSLCYCTLVVYDK